jgi:glutaminyl-tRNA synthetase
VRPPVHRTQSAGREGPGLPGVPRDYREFLNPHSLDVIENAIVEPHVADGEAGDFYQFERTGYFCHDTVDSITGRPVLNRIVTLRDSWARIEKEMAQAGKK